MRKQFILTLVIMVSSLTFASNLTPTNWINDYSNVLTPEQESSLNSTLSNFEKQTSIEFTYAIVDSLGGEDIDSYTNKLFRQWGVGKEGANNGLLVVIAVKEHKYRIETGYGLEPYLTDNICYRLTRANFPTNFKAGNYFVGINSFTDDVMKELGKITWADRMAFEKQRKLKEEIRYQKTKSTIIDTITIIFLLGLITFVIVYVVKYNKKKRILNELKQDYANKYKSEINEINKTLSSNNFATIKPDEVELNLITSGKNENEVYYNYLHSQRSLLPTYELIKNWELFLNALNDYNKTYDALIKKQKENNITVSSKLKFIFNNYTFNKDLLTIKKQTSLNKELTWDIEVYNTLISKNINNDDVDRLCSDEINRFNNEIYKLDYKIVTKLNTDLKFELDIFNSLEKTFVNSNRLRTQFEKYNEKINALNYYVKTIEDKNREHKKILEYIRNAPNVVDEYNFKLNNYLKNDTVSDNTKTVITTFLVTLLAFSYSSIDDDLNVLKMKEQLDSLFNETEKVVKLAETDLEKERNRIADIKRREDDERRRKKRLEEEEEEAERRRRSYSSSSSYSSYSSLNYGSSSYDSGSSFGGGDSGGGGSSGSW